MMLFLGKKKIANNLIIYRDMLSQAIGLRFKKIKKSHAYLFPVNFPMLCIADTFFVNSEIDIYFLDGSFKVIGLKKRIKPFRVVIPKKNTRFILETSPSNKIKINDVMRVEYTNLI